MPRTTPVSPQVTVRGKDKNAARLHRDMEKKPDVKGRSTGHAAATAGSQRLIHDLQVHQTRLEMRNDDLEEQVRERTAKLRQINTTLTQEIRFEKLIADLSARFVHVPADRVDGEIENAQRRICQTLGLDRSTLFQFNGPDGEALLTHSWAIEGFNPVPKISMEKLFPWALKRIRSGKTIQYTSLDDAPGEAATDKASVRRFGPKSNITFPLIVGGEVLGGLGFGSLKAERQWPESLISRLQLIAQIIATALARRDADQALRNSEKLSRATFEQAAVGIAHVGVDGRWLRVNNKLCEIFGYSRDEMMKLKFQDITCAEELETDVNYMNRMLSGEIQTYTREKRYIRKNGAVVWGNLSVSLVRNEAGRPMFFISVVEDITERKRAEEELQRVRLQLWHADRVAHTGAITVSLAHELNQPLTAILANAQAGLRYMAAGNPDLEEIREILEDIVQDDKRAGAVVSGLRSILSRRQTMRADVDLAEVIQDSLDLLRSELIGRQVEIGRNLEPESLVLADRAQIQQVILNLVINAVEAMHDPPTGQRQLNLNLTHTEAGDAMVAVRDTGPGISEEHKGRIFESFWTTKEHGMGIGLQISRSIIESHSGRLWFADNPGGGAIFYFTIPLKARDS